MAIREIPGFSNQAIGAGCFFLNDGGRKEIRDKVTGELRFERTFTTDRYIEWGDEGIIEFSERAANMIAATLGWLAPQKRKELEEQVKGLEAREAELETELAELRTAYEVQTKQMGDYLRWAEAKDEAEAEAE